MARYGWMCHAYVAMHNHYPPAARDALPNLSLGMRQLNGLYAQWFNRRHGRSGHVFGDGPGRIAVGGDEHFLEAARYVVLDPLRTSRPTRFEDWRWSSYQATGGLAAPPPFLTVDEILGRFDARRGTAQAGASSTERIRTRAHAAAAR